MIEVHVLWIGGPLPALARLSLAAYTANGCSPILWTYDPLRAVKDLAGLGHGGGIEICDAKAVVPEEMIDRLAFGPRKQLALFSDFFAWNVIYKYGGWFGHLDMTLLKPIDDLDRLPFVFGPHHRYRASMALWKAPASSTFTSALVRSSEIGPPSHWHAMMERMSMAVEELSLDRYRVPGLLNDDWFHFLTPLLREGSRSFPLDYYGLHWCGSGSLDTLGADRGSYFAALQERYL